MTTTAIQIAITLLAPPAVAWLVTRSRVAKVVGSVVLCYAVGVIVGNVGLPIDADAGKLTAGLAVVVAIPLLLLSADVRGWLRLAPSALISFALCIVVVCGWALGAGWLFSERVERSAEVAGMLVGTYTGGAANMAAIGEALGVENDVLIATNAADLVIGTVYLVFLLSVAPRVYGAFLRPFQAPDGDAESSTATTTEEPLEPPPAFRRPKPRHVGAALGLTAVCVAVGAGVGALVPEGASDAVTILGVTTAAIAMSFQPRIRSIPGTYAAGQLVLLVFCTAIGTLADLRQLFGAAPDILALTSVVVLGSIGTHALACAALRIDRDTFVITNVAALYGPAFVPPVADRLRNPAVTLSGIAMGLAGYAVGNYLGIGVGLLLRSTG